jgi:uncharacterized protein (UPF0147 family)
MNAFASMSTFDDLEEASSDNLRHQHNNNNNNNNVFLEVLQIMQQVTRDQRRPMVSYHNVERSVMDSCQELRDKLSQARRKTSVLCREAILTILKIQGAILQLLRTCSTTQASFTATKSLLSCVALISWAVGAV